jgi:Sap, sulfolipid-1-addressing protein
MIGQALGQVLSQAIGIAISPVPIIFVIVVLFSRRATTNAAAFLLGWAVGVLAVFLIASAAVDGATDDGPSDTQGVVQLLLGLLFLVLAVRQWRSRPAPGTTPEPPAFLAKVETMGPAVALGLGLLLTAVNPKNLALLISAGADAGQFGLDAGELAVVAVVFLLVTMIGVAAPVVLTLALGDRAQGILHGWEDWLSHNNNTVMLVLFAVLAFKMLGSGISALSA